MLTGLILGVILGGLFGFVLGIDYERHYSD